jgi:oxygen-independent coproporphyrinogen-3 oxidase
MSVADIHGLSVDIERVRTAIGSVPRVAYEAAHVYPLSAPRFTPRPGAERERPAGGPQRLYVHIPFCRYACTFCFYAKRVNTPRAQMQRYVDALRRELDHLGHATALRQLYIGGGTPTALPADLLDDALAAISARLPLDESGCHTVECSPESLTAEHADVLRRRGIGRASLGVQTLDESLLQSINRRHSARQALDACTLLLGSGLSVNVDLIYGFAGQSEESLRRDLEAFAALGVHSFTLYNLRLNERTPLATAVDEIRRIELPSLMRWRRFVNLVTEELGYRQTRWHMFQHRERGASGHDRAPGINGFGEGRELGIGVSAYSHLGETIYRNNEGFDAYLRRVEAGESPVEDVFPFAAPDRKALFLAKTLGEGRQLDARDYAQAFGRSVYDDYGSALDRLRSGGLVRDDSGCLALTEVGRLVYDLVTIAFYPDEARHWLARRQDGGARRSAAVQAAERAI